MKIVITCISIFCAVTVHTLCAQTTYYVSVSGNDNNNGTTLNTPWRHVNYAVIDK